ncbi:TIGR02206 family membrane protein [Anaerococcus jeddahensis]|uniref:YwaF family protein n=1 Tax=Anaerococcus jeddahensis TaxID=1673719 RepID=UPI0006724AF9|nr:TIGR02206 family membrane protein [Anaerococcus jeddahensis]
MKDFIEVFFRKKEDGFVFNSYGSLHLFLFSFMIFMGFLMYRYRKNIRENKKIYKILRNSFIFLLAFQQLSFLFFLSFIRHDTISEALPLYTCRVSIYSGFFALLFNNKNLKILTIFWGLIGGLIGMIYPDLSPYSWPHIMYVNFFLTHYLVFWVSLFFLVVDGVRLNRGNLKFLFIFVNIFLIITELINLKFGLNYAYLSYSPIFTDLLKKLPGYLYFILAGILYNFSIILNYYIFKKLNLIEVK